MFRINIYHIFDILFQSKIFLIPKIKIIIICEIYFISLKYLWKKVFLHCENIVKGEFQFYRDLSFNYFLYLVKEKVYMFFNIVIDLANSNITVRIKYLELLNPYFCDILILFFLA